jgi:hypothetical protein
MCQSFGLRPSEVLGLAESSIALDFDLAAAVILDDRNQAIENARAEAMLTAGAMGALGGGAATDDLPDGTEPRPGVTYHNTQLV